MRNRSRFSEEFPGTFAMHPLGRKWDICGRCGYKMDGACRWKAVKVRRTGLGLKDWGAGGRYEGWWGDGMFEEAYPDADGSGMDQEDKDMP